MAKNEPALTSQTVKEQYEKVMQNGLPLILVEGEVVY